jgi:ceramide glucosyltransferase
MMNGYAAPLLMVASVAGRDVGFGKVMLFGRRDFERAGGIAVMTDTFGDDHALAKAFARAGLRTVFSAGVIRQVIGARSLRDVWTRQLRWMTIRRDEEPLAFYPEPLASGYFATLMAMLAAPTLGLAPWTTALAMVALWLASEALIVAGRGWGWSWQYPLAALCREPLMLAMWVRAWSARKVQWGGSTFDLSGSVP